MSERPRIGITVHSARVVAKEGHEEVRFEVGSRYAEAIAEAGGLPVLLPTHPGVGVPPEEVIGVIDGLLLSGGGSLRASFFSERPAATLRDTNPERHDVEVALALAAAARKLPLLGVCRGHQTLVEALGGSIVNLPGLPGRTDHYQSEPPERRTQGVTVVAGSRLGRLLPPTLHVNSFHRQAVGRLPPGFTASVFAADGTIEAVEAVAAVEVSALPETAIAGERPGTWFAVGCQFHPEWLCDQEPGFAELFREFVGAARAYASARPSGEPAGA